jgi:hypothetical protein
MLLGGFRAKNVGLLISYWLGSAHNLDIRNLFMAGWFILSIPNSAIWRYWHQIVLDKVMIKDRQIR